MKVKELIEWLSKQDQELDVEVGLNDEYQSCLDMDQVQVFNCNGEKYVLLGEYFKEE